MNDKTTEGYAVSTEEVEGMLRNLCAYAIGDPEPLRRYRDLTHQQVLFDGVVAAIRRERGRALADLAGMGIPIAKVAEMADLGTPQRVKWLMTAAGVTAPTARKAVRKATSVDVESTDARERDADVASARAGVPMLPATIVSGGKRTLRSIGRQLMQALHDVAQANSCSRIEWTTDVDNPDAQHFYESLGFDINDGKVFYRATVTA